MGINLIRRLAGAVLLSVLQRRPIQITKEKLVNKDECVFKAIIIDLYDTMWRT